MANWMALLGDFERYGDISTVVSPLSDRFA
jgi:hypothetical protein